VRIRTWCLAVILLISTAAYAERLPVRAYTGADGLADNHVNRIRQDSRAFIWIATDEGLSRFDGDGFTNYTTAHGLPHRWVNDLIETHHGEYWVATDNGVCRFDPAKPPSSNSAFTCYHPGPSQDARRVNALAEDTAGVVWCGTYDGIYRIEIAQGRVSFTHADIPVPAGYEGSLITSLLFDHEGQLWAASRSGLYHRLANGGWERYAAADNLPDTFIDSLLEDRAGRLWLGTRSAGVCVMAREFAARSVVERCYSMHDGLPANDVRALWQTSDGHLWIATVSGLSEFQRSGRIVTYTTANGLSDSTIYRLAEDRTGNLWIGTKNAGIMRLDRHGFVTYGEADGFRSDDYVSSIFEMPGQLCVVSGSINHRSIQCFDGRRFATVELPIPSRFWISGSGWYQGALLDRDHTWWVPTADGLYRFPAVRRAGDLRRAKADRFESAEHKVVELTRQDQSGDVWIAMSVGSGHELLRWEHSTHHTRHVQGLAVSNGKILSALARDSTGQLWFGFRVSGFREDGGIVRCHDDSPLRCEIIEGVPRGDIQALYVDRKARLWVGSSQGGLARLDELTDAHPRFAAYYTTASGLSGDEVLCITEDQRGRIWVGTNKGLNQIDPSTGALRHVTQSEGLGPGRVQAAYADDAGNLWFATHQVVSRLQPLPGFESAPKVRITGLRVSGAALPLSALGENRPSELFLGASENSLQIDFAGVDLSPGAPLRYQVFLEGLAKDWSPPAEARAVDFQRLPSGAYRLLVRAINADGIGSAEPATLTFTIAQPVWRRWWFVLLATGSLVLVAYYLHRYRLTRALQLAHVRERIATDLHDEIGSSLSRLAILSEVVQRDVKLTGSSESARLLDDISATSRGLVDLMSDVVWSIDPRRDDLRSLVTRIRGFASDMLEAKGIAWEFRTPAETDQLRLSPEQRRDVYLMFKEAITNIVRHAQCSSVSLSMEINGACLIGEIRDDGCGFGVDTVRGRGLTNIEARATRIRGACTITSAPGEGTSIMFHAPLS
jgi:ligand-binding sensor domain-containing protein/signal transduction histidine kinase